MCTDIFEILDILDDVAPVWAIILAILDILDDANLFPVSAETQGSRCHLRVSDPRGSGGGGEFRWGPAT